VTTRRPGARKAEILDIATVLFQRSGFHNVGMDDIGEAAGITGPALYFHFPSKTGLLITMMERVADELLREAPTAEPADPADALRRLVARHVEFALDERALIAVWTRDDCSLPSAELRQLRKREGAYLTRWVELLRDYNPDLDQAEAVSIVRGVWSFIASIAFYEPELDRERVGDLLEMKATACLLERAPKVGKTTKARDHAHRR
jgi:AcrR family transcriptional regulator